MNYQITIFCIVALANLCIAQSIVDISPTQTKNPGESVVFNCTVKKSIPNQTVAWLKGQIMYSVNNILTSPDSRFEIVADEASGSYNLKILNLTKEDSGRYRCQVNVDMNNNIGRDIDLQVTRPPVILDSGDNNFRAAEGQNISLTCNADGYPRPEVTWRRENNDIMTSKEFIFKGNKYAITQVKKEDRGRYICEASNSIGKASKAVLLEVSFAPILTAKRPKVGQKEGYEAKLICKSTSYPPAAISFLHKDKEINNNEHYQIEYQGKVNEETEAILTLHEVKKHHYGEYLCKAKNAFGAAETRLELFEQELPNEIFSLFRRSSGHRFMGFHHFYTALCSIIFFRLFY